MERHPLLSRHPSGSLPFAAANRQTYLVEIHAECVHWFLSLAGFLVLRLEDHRHQRFGFAFAHVGAVAEHFGLLASVLPPLRNPHLAFAVLAGADASLLKSFLTHQYQPFLRPKRCILT